MIIVFGLVKNFKKNIDISKKPLLLISTYFIIQWTIKIKKESSNSHALEAVVCRWSAGKLLLKVFKNSQENTLPESWLR